MHIASIYKEIISFFNSYISSKIPRLIKSKKDFIYPSEIVLSIIKGINLYEEIKSEKVRNYLEDICYPEGIEKIDLKIIIEKINRGHLPIIRMKNDKELLINNIHSLIDKVLINYSKNLNYWYIVFDEIINNIIEHSEAKEIILFGQKWKKLNSLELIIYDDGIGFFNSLNKVYPFITSHEIAIQKIIKENLSSKSSKERGQGIKTLIKLITYFRELKGEILIISGDYSFYNKYNGEGYFFKLPTEIKGVFIGFKLNNIHYLNKIYPLEVFML